MSRAIIAVLLLSLNGAPVLAADTGFYLGAGIGQGRVEDVDVPGFDDFDDDDTGWKVIAGWRARLEFENFEVSDTDTDMLTLGVTWTFD